MNKLKLVFIISIFIISFPNFVSAVCVGVPVWEGAAFSCSSEVTGAGGEYQCSSLNDGCLDGGTPCCGYNCVWYSSGGPTQWAVGDLGVKKCIEKVRIYVWTDGSPETVDIQVSDDAILWTTLSDEVSVSTGSWVETTINAEARYVRALFDSANDCISGGDSLCTLSEIDFFTSTFCIPEPASTTCSGVSCGTEINNCGELVACGTCDDGNFCNGAEVCNEGTCGPGLPACDDSDPCTVDSCDEPSKSCQNTFTCVTECNDLIDNDGDTLIDLLDPSCTDVTDDSEFPLNTLPCSDDQTMFRVSDPNNAHVSTYGYSLLSNIIANWNFDDLDPIAELAYDLDQQYDLTFTGDYSENWGGAGEKWMQGNNPVNPWYFIIPNGDFYNWIDGPQDPLNGGAALLAGSTYLATFSPLYHVDPTLLHNAQQPTNLIVDSSGNGNDGTNFGANSILNGQINIGLEYDGNNFIDVSDLDIQAPATISMWISPDNNVDIQGLRLFSQLDGLTTNGGSLSLGGDEISSEQGALFVWDGNNWDRLSPNDGIINNVWQHIVVVYNGQGSDNVDSYINGILQPFTGTSDFDFKGVNTGIAGLFLGTSGNHYNGDMDEVKIFDKALSANDVFELYNSELSNVNLYDIQVCYDQIYGTGYMGVNPHLCTQNNANAILWLSSLGNSHVSTSEISGSYEFPICFGDLECTERTGICNLDEQIVASLSESSNSHISQGDDPSYPIKLCCKSTQSLVNTPFWGNMRELQISTTDLNDKVKLIVSGSQLNNVNMDFKIYQKDLAFGIDWWDPDPIVGQFSDKGFTTWRAGKKEDSSLSEGDYYFEVIIDGQTYKTKDNPAPFDFLTVSSIEDNSPPIANIFSPNDGGIFFKNIPIDIQQTSYDVDDDFSFSWEFDSSILIGDSISLNNFNLTHSYITDGQDSVKLRLVDDRELTGKDESTILVIDPPIDTDPSSPKEYIIANIDYPLFGQIVGGEVNFDATGTYAIETSYSQTDLCTVNINCIGGNCPSQTEDCPSCYLSQGITCPIDISGIPQTPDFSEISFSWEFEDSSNTIIESVSIPGLPGATPQRNFGTIGKYYTDLTTTINPSSSISTEFDVFFNIVNPICIIVNDNNQNRFPDLNKESYWKDQNSFPTKSKNDCFRSDGLGLNGEVQTLCCPLGFECDTSTSPGKCIEVSLDARCEDFTTKQNCDANEGHIPIATQILDPIIKLDPNFPGGCDFEGFYGNTCTESVTCKCSWNSLENECQPTTLHQVSHQYIDSSGNTKIDIWDDDNLPSNIDQICNDPSSPKSGNCILDVTYTGSCEEGDANIIRSWIANFETNDASANDPDYCQNGNDFIPCERKIKLGFFNFINLIITLSMITIIYYFSLNSKKNKK